jgi:DNA repair exonuclease SbcCD nuclease subunit
MTPRRVRLLLLADTHLGFDLPVRATASSTQRRGHDFFANTERALAPALAGAVELVVHGGDLLFRSRVRAALVDAALAPFRRVADAGVPVYLVPGNHERSSIPCGLLARHPRLHVFDRPRTFVEEELGVALSGFPFTADAGRFAALVEETGWRAATRPIQLLCIHQAVEGGRAGFHDHVFTGGAETVRARDLPRGFAAILSGHLHRPQTLIQDLAGRRLAAPVLYPGSVERTSFAEREERKGYLRLELEAGPGGGRLVGCRFVPLPTRPPPLPRPLGLSRPPRETRRARSRRGARRGASSSRAGSRRP